MFDDVVLQVMALAGFAALVSFVVNALKYFGVVKDGSADKWVAGINLAGVLVVYALGILRVPFDLATVDKTLMEIATVGVYILNYLVTIGASKLTYFLTRGLPFIGKTNSVG